MVMRPWMGVVAVALSGGVGWAQAESSADSAVHASESVPAPVVATQEPEALAAHVAGELFSAYRYDHVEGDDVSEFALDRGEVGLVLGYGGWAGGEIRVESIRSAGPGSVMGIDQNSLVVRMKRAWGFAGAELGAIRIEAQGGLIVDPWIGALERTYAFRDFAPTLAERATYFDTSDLGGALVLGAGEDDRLRFSLAVTNGEGRNQIEQNDGKNLTAVVSARLATFPLLGGPMSLFAHLAGRDGSVGAASAQNRRLAAAVAVAGGPSRGVGVEVVRAFGFGSRSELDSQGLGAWLVSDLGWLGVRWGGIAARWDLIDQDVGAGGSWISNVRAGVFAEPFIATAQRRLRVYLAYEGERFGGTAGPFPGSPDAADADRLLLILSLASQPGVELGRI